MREVQSLQSLQYFNTFTKLYTFTKLLATSLTQLTVLKLLTQLSLSLYERIKKMRYPPFKIIFRYVCKRVRELQRMMIVCRQPSRLVQAK